MTVTIIHTKSLVPKNWRKTLEARLQKLSIPELFDAFWSAEQILESRSDAEVLNMANELVQSIAPMTVVANGPALPIFPRMIYHRYSDNLNSTPPKGLSLLESLAIGTLFALDRACDAMTAAKTKPTWQEVCTALASTQAFDEWLYFVSRLKSDADALELLFPRQVRKAVKKKVSAKASGKSKAYWDSKLAPVKKKVIEAYEDGKPWTNTLEAAVEIAANVVTEGVQEDKLYKWLLAYVKGKPF